MIIKTKTCTTCKIEQPITNFNVHKLCKDGFNTKCRACRTLKQQHNRKTNGYNAQIKYKYGITYKEFLTKIDEQGNTCILCGVEFNPTERTTAPCIDHDHTTGKVRGILCHPCNVALGLIKENTRTLRKMIIYLHDNH